MATDIELAAQLIQTKLRTLVPTYLAMAPDPSDYPNSMDDALCPYAMTWPEGGDWFQKGHGYKIDERTMTVFVFVESLRQQNIPTRTVQGMRCLAAVRNLFITPEHIPLDYGTTSGFQITVMSSSSAHQSDSGLRSDFPFTGVPWFGFSIPLKVRIQWQS